MTIPIPTIDDFSASSVMTTIREVVDYLIGMVPQINNGDITDLQTSYTNNTLTITLVKGDGTTISKNVTIQASGGESPYPTDVALSLSGTILNFSMTMNNGTPITGSVDLAPISSSGDGWEELDLSNLPRDFADGDHIKIQMRAIGITPQSSVANPGWNDEITDITISPSPSSVLNVIGEYAINDSSNVSFYNPLLFYYNTNLNRNYLQGGGIQQVNDSSDFNNNNNNTILFIIFAYVINGAGQVFDKVSVTRSNITNYVYKMWRKKKA